MVAIPIHFLANLIQLMVKLTVRFLFRATQNLASRISGIFFERESVFDGKPNIWQKFGLKQRSEAHELNEIAQTILQPNPGPTLTRFHSIKKPAVPKPNPEFPKVPETNRPRVRLGRGE